MTDVFFSYSSKDRERVRRFKDCLEGLGFSVFWDLETPTGKEWNSWIRENLDRARCVVVFWSANSLLSDPVKTEADEAKRQSKLLPVQIDSALDMRKLPLGHDRMQSTSMVEWDGDTTDPTWCGLVKQIEQLATPKWVLSRLVEKEVELRTERRRVEIERANARSLEAEVSRILSEQQGNQRQQTLDNQLIVSICNLRELAKTIANDFDRTLGKEWLASIAFLEYFSLHYAFDPATAIADLREGDFVEEMWGELGILLGSRGCYTGETSNALSDELRAGLIKYATNLDAQRYSEP